MELPNRSFALKKVCGIGFGIGLRSDRLTAGKATHKKVYICDYEGTAQQAR